MKKVFVLVLAFSAVWVSCKQKPTEKEETFKREPWGQVDNMSVELVTMTNPNGMTIKITNYGGIITFAGVPDKNDSIGNVVLGFDNLAQYKLEHPYFGSLIGRYGNRIGGAKFNLNDTVYTLAANNGPNTLHGGIKSFGKQVFNIDTLYSIGDSSVLKLSRLSPHMEEGFPGNLQVSVTYTLTPDNEIVIEYEAETDRPTVLNLTNHSYFNLTGGKESILGHELTLFADSITPTDDQLIPTGDLASVAGTPFDFTSPHAIGERIENVPGGYDINYKLRNTTGEYVKAAEVFEPTTGRVLEAFTTEPGVQLYSGNFLNGQLKGHDGIIYNKHFGFCLEMQHFPDSPNKPQFPSTVLNPGEKYTQKTVYKFSVR
ncbi:MAG TPA: aldose epimerase family protein [Bacteroidales bacterium]|nr:aldose epimerase family protein [Bacteroidales bacterium]